MGLVWQDWGLNPPRLCRRRRWQVMKEQAPRLAVRGKHHIVGRCSQESVEAKVRHAVDKDGNPAIVPGASTARR